LGPCRIVKVLQVAFAKASESEPLLKYLEEYNFKCTKAAHETRCNNTLEVIDTPTRPFAVEPLGPDYLEIFITNVVFKQAKPAPLAPPDIKLTFSRLARPFRN
jgi:hypothetical protein